MDEGTDCRSIRREMLRQHAELGRLEGEAGLHVAGCPDCAAAYEELKGLGVESLAFLEVLLELGDEDG